MEIIGPRDQETWEGQVTGTSNKEHPTCNHHKLRRCECSIEMCHYSHLNYYTQLMSVYVAICQHLILNEC